MPEKPKPRGSTQLNRWSRARAIRSGLRHDRKNMPSVTANPNPIVETGAGEADPATTDSSEGSESAAEEELVGKAIYMVSYGTGWTIEHSVTAALGQFEHCLVDRICPINTHLFSGGKSGRFLAFSHIYRKKKPGHGGGIRLFVKAQVEGVLIMRKIEMQVVVSLICFLGWLETGNLPSHAEVEEKLECMLIQSCNSC